MVLLLAWLPESPPVLPFEALEEFEELEEPLPEDLSALLEVEDSLELPLLLPFPLWLSLLADTVSDPPSGLPESDFSEEEDWFVLFLA